MKFKQKFIFDSSEENMSHYNRNFRCGDYAHAREKARKLSENDQMKCYPDSGHRERNCNLKDIIMYRLSLCYRSQEFKNLSTRRESQSNNSQSFHVSRA